VLVADEAYQAESIRARERAYRGRFNRSAAPACDARAGVTREKLRQRKDAGHTVEAMEAGGALANA
jgi:hypothetical protein